MSDDVTAAIESSIADLPGSEASGDSTPEPTTPPAETTPVAEPAAPPAETKPPEDAPTVAMPLGEERPKRRGPIPFERHEAALANARTEAETQAIAKIKAEYEPQLQTTRAELQAKQQLIALADNDPAMFLEALSRVDPRYAQILQRGGNGHAEASPQQLPGPDREFADGSVGYSPEGLQKLLDAYGAQIEDRVVKRFAPIENEHRANEQMRGAVGRVRAQVEDAMSWPLFTEHQGEIAAALKANRSLNLEGAYRQVVFPKLRADRDTVRAQVLAEINAKPKAASGTSPAGGVPPSSGNDDLETIIKNSIAHLPR